jgi:pilus assembly protein CpaD
MNKTHNNKLLGAVALALGVGLAGCSTGPLTETNTSLYSVNQPVVERTNFTLDVDTSRSGLSVSEQQRVNGWFETMDLRYGDRVTVEDPSSNPAVADAVNQLAGRYGLIVETVAPTTPGLLGAGQARVPIGRVGPTAISGTRQAKTMAAPSTATLQLWSPILRTLSKDNQAQAKL